MRLLIVTRIATIAVVLLPLLCVSPSAQAQVLTSLYSFTGGTDGGQPYAGVIRDSSGNIYGTTWAGGAGQGTIFEVDKTGKETVLHTFTFTDGAVPVAPLVRDAAGAVKNVAVQSAPAHNYILGVDFQGDDLWVATAKGLSHGIRQHDAAETARVSQFQKLATQTISTK